MILVLNCGSSSLKFKLFDLNEHLLVEGDCSNIGTKNSRFKFISYGVDIHKFEIKIQIENIKEAVVVLKRFLMDKQYSPVNNLNDIKIIGHRIVHGGDKFTEAVVYDDNIYDYLKEYANFNITHFENAISVINTCKRDFNNADNLVVFDTAFHASIPLENYLYPIPQSLAKKYKIRKYGFHGISYSYVLKKYETLTGNLQPNVILCHLGGGSSICAVKNGKSYDTTMGLTPNSGLMMSSRCGNIDPMISAFLMDKQHSNFLSIYKMLNEDSGYFSLANTKDAKEIINKCYDNDQGAKLLRKMICHDFKKNLLSMMASYSSIDSIVLTGGMGTKNIKMRESMLDELDYFGIKLSKQKNETVFNKVGIISDDNSKISVYVIPTDEEFEIYSQCKEKILKK